MGSLGDSRQGSEHRCELRERAEAGAGRFGSLPLQKLTTVHVEDMVDWMLTSGRKRGGQPGTGLSPRSVQLTLSRLNEGQAGAVDKRTR
jgi:hypothetical protein